MRSLMFVPGHNEALLKKAAQSEADVLLLDVEDSVQPASNKEFARGLIKSLSAEGFFKQKQVFVRINDRESGELLDDLFQLTLEEVDGFVYPKSKGAEDIFFIDRLLESLEAKKGFDTGRFKLIPLIETAEAVLNVLSIAKSSQRIVALAYGCEDFLADLEGSHDLDEIALHVPRAMIAMAARSAGITPIDTVHIRVHDLDDLEKNLRIAKTLGFEGMLILNPKEIPLVHRVFSPSEREIEWAREIAKSAERAVAEGVGVAIINGKFVGPPVLAAAQKILSKHKLISG
jgi:citrate lyase subunit beta / citryl-CoA lyase